MDEKTSKMTIKELEAEITARFTPKTHDKYIGVKNEIIRLAEPTGEVGMLALLILGAEAAETIGGFEKEAK